MLKQLCLLIIRYVLPVIIFFTIAGATLFDKTGHTAAQYTNWMQTRINSQATELTLVLKLFTLGFVITQLCFSPIYLYGWATERKRFWNSRFFSLSWRNARFRTVVLCFKTLVCLLIFVISINLMPILVAFIFFTGSHIAFHKPLILNSLLSIVDLYSIKPSTGMAQSFNNIFKFKPVVKTQDEHIISPTIQRTQTPKAKNYKNDKMSNKIKSSKSEPLNIAKTWQDKINQ